MAQTRDELLERDMTSKEIKALVDEFLANGGVITQCAPGVALNYRSALGDVNASLPTKRAAGISQKRRAGKSAKSKGKS